tara:strand:- start:86 stop:337 length:252 start_codon:yes stop_codon:yes gene_type:complete
MKDYTVAPTEEFDRIMNQDHRHGMLRWFTMMKSVMNDYYFENGIDGDIEFMKLDLAGVDLFFHKMYFCWQELGKELFDWEEEE